MARGAVDPAALRALARSTSRTDATGWDALRSCVSPISRWPRSSRRSTRRAARCSTARPTARDGPWAGIAAPRSPVRGTCCSPPTARREAGARVSPTPVCPTSRRRAPSSVTTGCCSRGSCPRVRRWRGSSRRARTGHRDHRPAHARRRAPLLRRVGPGPRRYVTARGARRRRHRDRPPRQLRLQHLRLTCPSLSDPVRVPVTGEVVGFRHLVAGGGLVRMRSMVGGSSSRPAASRAARSTLMASQRRSAQSRHGPSASAPTSPRASAQARR